MGVMVLVLTRLIRCTALQWTGFMTRGKYWLTWDIRLRGYTYLTTGPRRSRCKKRTNGRSLPRSRWKNVSAIWIKTAGTNTNEIVKPSQMVSSVLWYMLHITEAVMNSAQYSNVASTTLNGGWMRLWLTTSMTPSSMEAPSCSDCSATSGVSLTMGSLSSMADVMMWWCDGGDGGDRVIRHTYRILDTFFWPP